MEQPEVSIFPRIKRESPIEDSTSIDLLIKIKNHIIFLECRKKRHCKSKCSVLKKKKAPAQLRLKEVPLLEIRKGTYNAL